MLYYGIVFLKEQQVTHHTQLVCWSFIWREAQTLWVVSLMPSWTSERQPWSRCIDLKVTLGHKCALETDMLVLHWCISFVDFIYWLSKNVWHLAMTVVILENKANKYQVHIPKSNLWSLCYNRHCSCFGMNEMDDNTENISNMWHLCLHRLLRCPALCRINPRHF